MTIAQLMLLNTVPSETRPRDYNGDYMKLGKIAEEIVMKFLTRHPHVIGVDDLRDLRVMHEADVDVCIKTCDGRVTLAEIKCDTHLGVSGNVLFEVLRVNHTAPPDRAVTLGWAARSPATYLLYYAPSSQTIYQCRFDDLRRRVQQYTKEKRKNTRLDWVSTDNIKSTLNILVPMQYCNGIFTVYDVSNLAGELPF